MVAYSLKFTAFVNSELQHPALHATPFIILLILRYSYKVSRLCFVLNYFPVVEENPMKSKICEPSVFPCLTVF